MKIPGNFSQAPVFVLPKNTNKADSLSSLKSQQFSLPAKMGESLSNLLSSLKLPQDSLSRLLIGAARFFSLPLESTLLNSLRREVLNQTGAGTASREAVSLGAAAAADKGLKLGEKALGEYAAAIEGTVKYFTGINSKEPPALWQAEDREGGGQQSPAGEEDGNQKSGNQEKNGSQHGKEGGSFRNDVPSRKGESGKEEKRSQAQMSANSIQRQLTGALNNRPLLDLINRIPGKDKHWIVIPFSYRQDDFEFIVSLRILLNKGFSPPLDQGEHLIMDIRVNRSQWIISLERPKSAANERSAGLSPGSRAAVFSERANCSSRAKKRLRNELSKALGLPLDNVLIGEKQPLFDGLTMDHLRSVDEEV